MVKWLKTGFGWLKTANQFYSKVKGSAKIIFWLGDVLAFAEKSYGETFEGEIEKGVESNKDD
ncbi:MAG: hypothetical protein COA58_02900 [Bacteroidetes bacterium]|nr:MAG: hypothetical protein COA58_02900 [Bacteroidota bacterium]